MSANVSKPKHHSLQPVQPLRTFFSPKRLKKTKRAFPQAKKRALPSNDTVRVLQERDSQEQEHLDTMPYALLRLLPFFENLLFAARHHFGGLHAIGREIFMRHWITELPPSSFVLLSSNPLQTIFRYCFIEPFFNASRALSSISLGTSP